MADRRANANLRAGGTGDGALLGHVNTTQEWDGNGRLVRQTDDSGFNTVYEHDSFGRLARTVFADGANESYEYDGRGLLVATTKPDGTIMRQDHDDAGRLVARTADGAWPVDQSFEYDGLGRMTQATDGELRAGLCVRLARPTTPAPAPRTSWKWARCDLNARLLHPKQQGYQTTPRARTARGALQRPSSPRGLGRRGDPGPTHPLLGEWSSRAHLPMV